MSRHQKRQVPSLQTPFALLDGLEINVKNIPYIFVGESPYIFDSRDDSFYQRSKEGRLKLIRVDNQWNLILWLKNKTNNRIEMIRINSPELVTVVKSSCNFIFNKDIDDAINVLNPPPQQIPTRPTYQSPPPIPTRPTSLFDDSEGSLDADQTLQNPFQTHRSASPPRFQPQQAHRSVSPPMYQPQQAPPSNDRRVALFTDEYQGHGKIKPTDDREFKGYINGMEQLTDLVAGMYKDIKFIKKATTMQGAEQVVSDHNKNTKKPENYWTPHTKDITGPGGKPDGIEEVYITDGKGRIKMINGYSLQKTHYPEIKAFFTAYPDEASRKEFTKQQPPGPDGRRIGGHNVFRDVMSQVRIGADGKPHYLHNYKDFAGEEFSGLDAKRKINARTLFRESIFNGMWESSKADLKSHYQFDRNRDKKTARQQFLEFSREFFNAIYDAVVLGPVLQAQGSNIEAWNQMKVNDPTGYAANARASSFKKACIQRVISLHNQNSVDQIKKDFYRFGDFAMQRLEFLRQQR
jgi:hypothetical protein